MQESRTSVGYPLSMSSCFILSRAGPNLALEPIISAIIRLIVLAFGLKEFQSQTLLDRYERSSLRKMSKQMKITSLRSFPNKVMQTNE